jgi:hypothetical protein
MYVTSWLGSRNKIGPDWTSGAPGGADLGHQKRSVSCATYCRKAELIMSLAQPQLVTDPTLHFRHIMQCPLSGRLQWISALYSITAIVTAAAAISQQQHPFPTPFIEYIQRQLGHYVSRPCSKKVIAVGNCPVVAVDIGSDNVGSI